MSVKSIQLNSPEKKNYVHNNQNNKANPTTSFTGMGNPVVTLMDAIGRGGFAASFIAQDGIGMVAPRIYEGINRNRDKTGEYNWEFARREGIREILSGPSAFIIPSIIMAGIKKFSGSANNVSVDMIGALGDHFTRYAQANKSTLANANKAKSEFYENIFKNVLKNSTEQGLAEDELNRLAKHFTEKTIEIEKAKSKGFFNTLIGKPIENSAEDLTQALADEFMELRKANVNASSGFMSATVKDETNNKSVTQSFKKLLKSIKDYSNDAIEKTSKAVATSADANVSDVVKNFNLRRMGTRIASNASMFAAVVAFYTVIPKLYSLGLKGNPGLKGLEGAEQPEDCKKDKDKTNKVKNGENPSFTGAAGTFGKLADTVNNSSWLKKISNTFEFDGASMSVPAMLTLLFGFCLPPRYLNAKDKNGNPDKHDRKEILVRDVTSFIAILFAAKALARGFSDMFAKASGLALNTKPEDHSRSIFHKAKNYFTAGGGVNVLSSEEIVSKYSNIHNYKNGINGFFEFLENNGGNIKKTLLINDTVKTNAEKIIGKSLNDASTQEIKEAFKNVKNSSALEEIYKVFKNTDNQFIKRAKTMNSAFGFASTLVLVPVFMMWLAKYCERMTKNAVEKERLAKLAAQGQEQIPSEKTNSIDLTSAQKINHTQKMSMAGFLNK